MASKNVDSGSGRYSGLVVKNAERTPVNGDESGNSEDEEDSAEDKDSPAFRLRPRRSTPRPSLTSNSSSQGKKYSLLTAKGSPEFQARLSKLKYPQGAIHSATKRKLFEEETEASRASVGRPLSPSRSIVENLDVGVFAERIKLAEIDSKTTKYSTNYVCIKIISILKNQKEEAEETEDTNGEQVLKLVAQEADENLSLVDQTKPVVRIYLYGVYSKASGLTKGKILEILKFEIKPLAEEEGKELCFVKIDNECDIQCLPYSILVKDCRSTLWVPMMSIKEKCDPPLDESILKVATQPFLSPLSPKVLTEPSRSTKLEPVVKQEPVMTEMAPVSEVPLPVVKPELTQEPDSDSERELEIDFSSSSSTSLMSSKAKDPPSHILAPISVSIKQGSVATKVSPPVKSPPELNFSNYFSSVKYKEARQTTVASSAGAPVLRSNALKSKATSITITSSSVTINSSSEDS